MSHALELRYRSRIATHAHRVWLPRPLKQVSTLPTWSVGAQQTLSLADLAGVPVTPRTGRFYPSRLLGSRPAPAPIFRVARVEGAAFQADFNHPVARLSPHLSQEEQTLERSAVALGDGPWAWAGMEAPLPDVATDFEEPDAFLRDDTTADDVFYAMPRRVLHVDGVCAERIAALYSTLLPSGSAVLDLMSAWRSHLPGTLGPVTGLGMNAEEMADNPELLEYRVHDLNADPRLPFEDGAYQGAVCTVSLEYLTAPVAVLREVLRVLAPGAVMVASFSDRFFPPKVIRLWTRLHPMERLGWALDWMHRAGFCALHTLVERGLARSADDVYAAQRRAMDPLLAVWGYVPPR